MIKMRNIALVLAVPVVLAANTAGYAEKDKVRVIQVTAKKFEFSPKVIEIKRGVPVKLELKSLDRRHGFSSPALRIRTDIVPGKVNEVQFTPERAGTFGFFCDVFCGPGHETMTGKIVVSD